MADTIDDLIDQVDTVASHQLFTLDCAVQALHARLNEATSTDEAIALSQMLLATAHELRHWVDVALPGRSEPMHHHCGGEAHEEDEEDTSC